MPGNRDQQSRRGGKKDAATVRPSSRAGKGNRAARTRSRGRRRPVDESGFGRQGGPNPGKGVGTLGLELEGGQSREGGVGTLNLPLEGGVGTLGLELEGRDQAAARRAGYGSLDLELEGEDEGTGSLGLDLE